MENRDGPSAASRDPGKADPNYSSASKQEGESDPLKGERCEEESAALTTALLGDSSTCSTKCYYPYAVPNQNDVLCGRGAGIYKHSGNVAYRNLVNQSKLLYLSVPSKQQKTNLSKAIVHAIKHKTPPGRFLAKDKETNVWYELDNFQTVMKVSQALREDGPKLKKMADKIKMNTEQQQQLQEKLFPGMNKDMLLFETDDSQFIEGNEGRKREGPYMSRKKLLSLSEFTKKRKRANNIIHLLQSLRHDPSSKDHAKDSGNTSKEVVGEVCHAVDPKHNPQSQPLLVVNHDLKSSPNETTTHYDFDKRNIDKAMPFSNDDDTQRKNNVMMVVRAPSNMPMASIDDSLNPKATFDEPCQYSYHLPFDLSLKMQSHHSYKQQPPLLPDISNNSFFFSLASQVQQLAFPPFYTANGSTCFHGQDAGRNLLALQEQLGSVKVPMQSLGAGLNAGSASNLCLAPIPTEPAQASMQTHVDISNKHSFRTLNCTPDVLTSSADIKIPAGNEGDKSQSLISEGSCMVHSHKKPVKFTVRRVRLKKEYAYSG